ncbi:MAG: methylenetetrahydrofolate reductase C-terminal domain-containing protein [Chloroflexota bacterium]|nr:methylenetetrahydrofolate reductase C-terminal domain-containing protein [Chloroflexota bacterium]
MIVAEQKPLDELERMIEPFERVLILGCGTCVTVCDVGGEREVSFLAEALRLAEAKKKDQAHVFLEQTLKRQCDDEFIDLIDDQVDEVDAILSLACGIGVQSLAEHFPDTVVLPGVNTSFLGMAKKWGVWDEQCAACGDCRLEDTGGICPITRCTKGILNGPCAGAKGGKCEVNPEMECGWTLIYQRLERLGQLDKMRRYYPPRNFRPIPRPRRILVHPSMVPVGGSNG